jgi:hypothetical protein
MQANVWIAWKDVVLCHRTTILRWTGSKFHFHHSSGLTAERHNQAGIRGRVNRVYERMVYCETGVALIDARMWYDNLVWSHAGLGHVQGSFFKNTREANYV